MTIISPNDPAKHLNSHNKLTEAANYGVYIFNFRTFLQKQVKEKPHSAGKAIAIEREIKPLPVTFRPLTIAD